MYENMKVTLARIEERVIAIDDRMVEREVEDDRRHRELEGDIKSLKESRAKARGILVAVMAFLGWIGVDKFYGSH